MKIVLCSLVLFLSVVSSAESTRPFLADCWAGAWEVTSKYDGQDFIEFRNFCDRTLNGYIQRNHGVTVCIAQTYKYIKSDMPGEAINCPVMSPIQGGVGI